MKAHSGPQPPAKLEDVGRQRSRYGKVTKRQRIGALAWVQQTTPEEPQRPKHLRACTLQIRELEYRIREAERLLEVKTEYIHKLVVQQNNNVFIGLPDAMQTLAAVMAFLNGLRTAYTVLCTSGPLAER